MENYKLNKVDFFKGLYDVEIKRKEEFDLILTFPATILSISIGTIYFIINEFLSRISNVYQFIDYIFFIFSTFFYFSALLSIYFLVRVYYGFTKVSYIPSANEIHIYLNKLIEFQNKSNIPDDEKEKLITFLFNETLIEWYIECTNKNSQRNDKRSHFFYQSRRLIALSVIMLIISSIIGLMKIISNKKNEEKQPIEVIIKKNPDTKIQEPKKETQPKK